MGSGSHDADLGQRAYLASLRLIPDLRLTIVTRITGVAERRVRPTNDLSEVEASMPRVGQPLGL